MYFTATDTTTTEKWSLQIIKLFVKRKGNFFKNRSYGRRKMRMNSNKISTNLNYYTIVRMRRFAMGVTAEKFRGVTEIIA